MEDNGYERNYNVTNKAIYVYMCACVCVRERERGKERTCVYTTFQNTNHLWMYPVSHTLFINLFIFPSIIPAHTIGLQSVFYKQGMLL